MKTFSKNLLPVIHINPISRDLFLVIAAALVSAVALITAAMMVLSQI